MKNENLTGSGLAALPVIGAEVDHEATAVDFALCPNTFGSDGAMVQALLHFWIKYPSRSIDCNSEEL